jgi:hypothetical protein
MSGFNTTSLEFQSLLSVACCDDATQEDLTKLEAMVCDEPTMELVIDFFQVDGELHRLARQQSGAKRCLEFLGLDIASPGQSVDPCIATEPPSLVPTFFSATIHGAVGHFSSGWPLAYLVATVVVGIGLWISSVTPAFYPQQIAKRSSSTREIESAPEPQMVSVCRITAMADCQQVKGLVPLRVNDAVAVGRQFKLESGLMEIAYDSGAKVILQGPATYQVESAAGGFLSLGKLTAKVEKGLGIRDKSPDIPHPSSLIPHPLFVVRTPTATVTDLGTEFGVEVAKDGGCEVHVLTGLVQARFAATPGREPQLVRLKEGEGCRYRPQLGAAAMIPIDRAKFDGMRIAKSDDRHQRWLTYSRQLRTDPSLVVYYAFESVGKDSWMLPNVAPTGNALDAEIQGPLWTTGRFPGKVALRFRGPGSGDLVAVPTPNQFFAGPFSIAAWFKVAHFPSHHAAILTKGDQSWRLQQSSERRELAFTVNSSPEAIHRVEGRTQVDDNRWHLATAVYEPTGSGAHLRLFIDGVLDAENDITGRLHLTNEPVRLGTNSAKPDLEFPGMIDEVAIFARALSAKEVQTMFEAGNPAGRVQAEAGNNK